MTEPQDACICGTPAGQQLDVTLLAYRQIQSKFTWRDYRPILFVDFHGTISHQTFWNTLDRDHQEIIQAKIFSNSDFVGGWMRGVFDSRAACRLASDLTGLCETYLLSQLLDSCSQFSVNRNVVRDLIRLRAHYQLVLITANMDCFAAVARKLRLFDVFDRIANSADFGLLKEDKNGLLFKIVADSTGADLRKAVLLDDSPEVCRVFSNLGGRAIQVRNTKDTSSQLRQLLSILE